MKQLAKIISVLFHPVFLLTMGMSYIIFISQNEALSVPQGKEIEWFFTVFFSTLFLPIFLVFLLWKLDFIDSFQMKTTKERYVPLIACMSFYFWVFWIFHLNLGAGAWIKIFLLSSFITMVLTFLVTIFNKISLHLAGISSVFVYALLLNISTGWQDTWLLFVSAVAFGLVLFSRYELKAHTKPQLLIGGVLGGVSALITFFIF